MAEIKSTLDLVMEKTRHLKLNSREKAARQRDEFEKKIGGLLQQFDDRRIRLDQLKARLDQLRAECDVDDRKTLCRRIVARLPLGGDNRHWLELLEALCRVGQDDAAAVLQTFRRQSETLKETLLTRRREELAAEYGIRGSAVVPNLGRSHEWSAARRRIQEQFRSELIKRLTSDRLR